MNPWAVWLLCSFCFFLGFILAGVLIGGRNAPVNPSDVTDKETLDNTADAEVTAEWETIFCDRR